MLITELSHQVTKFIIYRRKHLAVNFAIIFQIVTEACKCEIRFCLVDGECEKIEKNIKCDSDTPFKWTNRVE